MNYFELFEIPIQFIVDKAALPRKYFKLSKKYHPDYFANETAEKQSEVLEINEQLMDMDESPELKQKMQRSIDNLQTEIYEPVKETVEHYKEGITTEKELLQVKEYYYKKKYLTRISQQLKAKL